MKFSETVDQASALLERTGRVSYRALQRDFDLDEDTLEDLKAELIDIREVAVDKDGKMLVWIGKEDATTVSATPESLPQKPASYTPPHLAERILAEQAAMEARSAADGERKTITALFADLKGSTALIEGLDPEEARAIIDPALQLMMDAVHRYDGYVAQALGDGIFALFGAPIAHEDHPQRALYAALRMQEEMRAYSDQSRLKGGIPLQMRVGINTGEVVVRSIRKDDLHTDYVPVGHSTNLAARMEQLANPGSIVISEYTRKLTEGYFELKSLGAAEIKGVEAPLNVYEVLGAGPLRTRLQISARRGLTRFVGRQSELDQMQRALEEAKAGHSQIVGVMGEPGLGKSRLFYEFKLTSQSGCLVLEAFSVSHGKASPYLPLIELLKNYFQIEPTDDERSRRERIIGKVLGLDRRLEDTLPYLFALLGIDDPESSLQQMDAQIRRQRTFEALKKLFLRESLNQPLLLIFEDLHWLDSETQGFLDTLSESLASAQLLLLVNYRPEYRHDWGGKTYYTQLRLAPLGKAEAEELLSFLLGNDASLTSLKSLILEKTEGTPFFMEEVVQTLVEEGALRGERGHYRLDTTPTELHISPTVQGVLAARIDRLSAEEKSLLQQLSVIGRQFPVSLVKRVVEQSEAEFYRVLSSLQAKEFLYEQPVFPEVEYVFKHALTQEVAYGTVLQEQRKALHERTGHAMETRYQESLDEHSSELAYHYQQSGNAEKAVEYLGRAGAQAVQRSANEEAIVHLTSAVALLRDLPDTLERAQQELDLQTALGSAFIAAKGYGASEVETAYARALTLAQQVRETPRLFPTLLGLWVTYLVQARHAKARELGEQLVRLAHSVQDSAFLLGAHYALGESLLYLGELGAAREHLEHSIAFHDIQQHRFLAAQYRQDPAVAGLCFLAFALWMTGFPTQALQRSKEALSLAQELAHPFSLAFASIFGAALHEFRQEPHAVQERTEQVLTLSAEHGFRNWLPPSDVSVLQGWVLARQGLGERGLALMRDGIDGFRAAGGEIEIPYFCGLLAEVYGQTGQMEAGLSLVEEALELVQQNGERLWEAEILRVKGELLVTGERGIFSPQATEAERCFHKALEVAQQQAAKSWELRAATSLARLWQRQDKKAEARDLLAPVYAWFTEGFDTKDLQEAKRLLDE